MFNDMPLKHVKQHAAAVLQVSILNGTDLKSLINYTGEQVSQAEPCKVFRHAPFPAHFQKSLWKFV